MIHMEFSSTMTHDYVLQGLKHQGDSYTPAANVKDHRLTLFIVHWLAVFCSRRRKCRAEQWSAKYFN